MSRLDDLLAEIESASRWQRITWIVVRLPGRVRRAPHTARSAIVGFWMRNTRGWDWRSVWSLDDDLTGRLGAQLVALADIAHGWPPGYPGGFDAWQANMRQHGQALLRYRREHHDNLDDDSIRDDAQAALYWVACNLTALWD